MFDKAPFPMPWHAKYSPPQYVFYRDLAATKRRQKPAGFMALKPYEKDDESKRGRVVRMSKSVMKSIGCSDDDVVIVKSTHGQAVSRCFGPSENYSQGRQSTMDGIPRKRGIRRIGGFVTISKAEGVVNATKIVLKSAEGKFKLDRKTKLAIEKSQQEMEGVPVTRESLFFFKDRDKEYTTLVNKIEPKARIGIIGKDTKITIA